ncbi:hypothetical protein [Stenotrophomonas sp. B1-1]|uniref:hypothetical protein n=1 Tax=Stenotrophomonas sp. B1-1 TaxID=2710648 RepID=UPI0013DB132A|nr:hypothetical protein [Stenotrophomonas sp. B1-1]
MGPDATTARTPATAERTKGEALLDVEYALELAVLSQRLYERLNKLIVLVCLLAGSAAFVTIFHPNSVVVTVAGMVVGLLTLVEQVYDFRGKGIVHANFVKRFSRLRVKAGSMTLEELDRHLGKINQEAIPVVQGLCKVARNNMLRRNGYLDFVRPLTRWERALQVWV